LTAPSAGRVYIVGAGPGDPGLLSTRAAALIAAADVILYDRLIPAEALDSVRGDAQLYYVGKTGGSVGVPSVPQSETEDLMVAQARAGRSVVRLKGGDPFVFGRGGEEAIRLVEEGISFEVVPGISSGLAATAYAGIPVTFRGVASAVALITGHEDADKNEPALDWPALAAFPGTLVFYMGVGGLPSIASSLIAAGRPASEPAALVESGTLPWQRTVTATLATLAERAQQEAIRPPTITVIGEVAALHDRLHWFAGAGERPLAGRTVVVTRARAQAGELVGRLRALGAEVLPAPTIRVTSIAGPPLDFSEHQLVCLTSPNGVHALFARLASDGKDSRALGHCTVAAIGPGTARALAEHGITADIVPERFVGEGLIDALLGPTAPRPDPPITRALLGRASHARDALPEALRAAGIAVDVVDLYETVPEPLAEAALQAAGQADYITFTSGSTVISFLDALDAVADTAAIGQSTRLVSIGPVTSETLRERGLTAHVQATRHDIDGLIEALLHDAASGPPAG
jgi:uroporphyrinogen III methyltransferase/synthase